MYTDDITNDTGNTTTVEGSVGTNSVGSSYAYETILTSYGINSTSGTAPGGAFSSYQSSTYGFIEYISNPPPMTTTESWTDSTSYSDSTYYPSPKVVDPVSPGNGPGVSAGASRPGMWGSSRLRAVRSTTARRSPCRTQAKA